MTTIPESAASAARGELPFAARTRLYALHGAPGPGWMVEAWTGTEGLSECFEWRIELLHTDAGQDLAQWLGRPVGLRTRSSGGDDLLRNGLVRRAELLASDGGFARYRITVVPWLWLASQNQRQRTWQDHTLVQIIDAVLGRYRPHAQWVWAPEVAAHLADARPRSLCTQARETDLAFIERLLAEEGLGYRFDDLPDPIGAHRLVLFADSVGSTALPEDACSAHALGGAGLRLHRAHAVEAQDALQAFGQHLRFESADTTLLSWDYKARQCVAASAPTTEGEHGVPLSGQAPRLSQYLHTGAYTHATSAQAQRHAQWHQQARESAARRQIGRSTVRSLRAGTWFSLTQPGATAPATPAPQYLVLRVQHVGINNLPRRMGEAVAKSLGPSPLLTEAHDPDDDTSPGGNPLGALWPDVLRQAAASGYGNALATQARALPWRPDMTRAWLRRPRAQGPVTGRVVGPQGELTASGATEIHTDRLGRIRVQLPWQCPQAGLADGDDLSPTSTWVRVAQPYAGAGLGSQFIPRIGQEVLVDFIGGDLDRPLVVGTLYNGRGEVAAATSTATASDTTPSGQGNQVGAGHSPAWHTRGALSGLKTQEFGAGGGSGGYNQLVFDDTDGAARVQLATTQHATQLNLGHLIHQADHHRGSARGRGFELRTDAYGAIRGSRGLLISTYDQPPHAPAADNAAGVALAQQAQALAQAFDQAASTHQTPPLAAHRGFANDARSALQAQAPLLQALHTALRTQVDAASPDAAARDAQARATTADSAHVPHTGAPVLAVAAKGGLVQCAGQDWIMANGEGAALMAGQDWSLCSGGAWRVHAGQGIGWLAGAVKPGTAPGAAGSGLTLVAAQGPVALRAHAGAAQVAAQGAVTLHSARQHLDVRAAQTITLATAGGASITLSASGLTVQCPGQITVKAATKSFVGPGSVPQQLPVMPMHEIPDCMERARRLRAGIQMRT